MTEIIAGIAAVLTGVGAIVGFVATFTKIIRRFEKLEEANKTRKEDTVMLTNCTFAILDGLTQLGCNGDVSKAKAEMQEYIIRRGD